MTRNFARLLEASARRSPDEPALVWPDGALTFAGLHRRAEALAGALTAKGVKPGDRIAVAIPNRWQFAVGLLAGWKLGATVAPLDPLLKSDERADVLADLAPAEMVDEAAVTDAGVESSSATMTAPGLGEPHPDPRHPALILYTSGSTGRPKGAVLSHEALAFGNGSWAGPVLALTPGDVVLAALPLSHSFGLNGALLAPLLAGATVALVERFSPEAALDAIRRHRVTVFLGVATMFRRILDSPALARADLSSARIVVSGAAPCPWELAREWRERTGIRILRGYGMSELFRPISYLAGDAAESPAAVGRPVPGVEVRVVDDSGRALACGEIGELWIKSPAAMQGYVTSHEETREVLTADGWFKTGDLAMVAPDGAVEIVGRKRERILRGGYSVFPQEVEAVLLTHPAVADAAVVGIPHPELGEEVAAFVVLRPGLEVLEADLIGHCRSRLAGFKYPRRITALDALPKSATGKVLKSALPLPSSPS